MPARTFKEASRVDYHRGEMEPTDADIKLGTLQRIADGVEKMASNWDQMRRERDRLRIRRDELDRLNDRLARSNRALRAYIRRLKRQGVTNGR